VKRALLLLALAACDRADVGGGTDARATMGDGHAATSDGKLADGHNGNALMSTLTSSCGTLQGRALVNYNGNLGIAFTIADSPYTFLGSVSFELPDGFTGSVPDPEHWDGMSDREVVAVSSPSYETFGNHCWFSGQPSGGSVVVTDFRPNQGIVKATFNGLQLKSCVGSSTCTVSGSIETTGSGVFD
jgi:hypothetical protein